MQAQKKKFKCIVMFVFSFICLAVVLGISLNPVTLLLPYQGKIVSHNKLLYETKCVVKKHNDIYHLKIILINNNNHSSEIEKEFKKEEMMSFLNCEEIDAFGTHKSVYHTDSTYSRYEIYNVGSIFIVTIFSVLIAVFLTFGIYKLINLNK